MADSGEQRDADTGDEHERRREAGRQRAVPRVEQLGGPAVADTRVARFAASSSEVAVEVHHDDTDQGDGADDVGAGEPALHDVAGRSARRRSVQSHSNSSTWVIVSGRCTSTRSPIAAAGLPGRDEAHRGVHVRRLVQVESGPLEVERALRPSACVEGVTPWAVAGTDHHEVTVAGSTSPRRYPTRSPPRTAARRARRRSAAASTCRRARAACRGASRYEWVGGQRTCTPAASRWLTQTGSDGSTAGEPARDLGRMVGAGAGERRVDADADHVEAGARAASTSAAVPP